MEIEELLTAGKKIKLIVDGGEIAPGTPQKTRTTIGPLEKNTLLILCLVGSSILKLQLD